jgi:hypothetical protein
VEPGLPRANVLEARTERSPEALPLRDHSGRGPGPPLPAAVAALTAAHQRRLSRRQTPCSSPPPASAQACRGMLRRRTTR